MPALLPADIERAERERVERKRPWLAFSRHEPTPAPKAERDPFAWLNVSDLIPISEENQ